MGIGRRTFALIFVKEAVSLKQWLLIYTSNFHKNDANVPKAQGGSKYLSETYSHLPHTVSLHSCMKALHSALSVS